MNRNYIPKKITEHQNLALKAKEKKQVSTAVKEKRMAIYAAFLFLLIMASLTAFFVGNNIFINKISISVFIISCILLVKTSGETQQL